MISQDSYGYGMWAVVLGLIALSLFFVTKYLPLRTRFDNPSPVMFITFFGFPLTIYLLSSLLGITVPLANEKGHLLGPLLSYLGLGNGWLIVMVASTILLLLGMRYIITGWRAVYAAEGTLVTTGIYEQMRHPQYAGIYLVIIAFMIQWPTLPTLIMFPFLIAMYYGLAKREEKEVLARFPREYGDYRERTPMFLTRLRS